MNDSNVARPEVLYLVFCRLTTPTLLVVAQVCRRWNQIIKDRFPRANNLVALYRTAEKLSQKDQPFISRNQKNKKYEYNGNSSSELDSNKGEIQLDPRHFVQKNGAIVFPPTIATASNLLSLRKYHHYPSIKMKTLNEPNPEGTNINTCWGNLTKDVLEQIFDELITHYKDEKDIVSISKVNKHWNKLINNLQTLWLVLYLNRYRDVESRTPIQYPISCNITVEANHNTEYVFTLTPQQKNMTNMMQKYYVDRRTIEFHHKKCKDVEDSRKVPLFVLPSSLVIHADAFELKKMLADENKLQSVKEETREYLKNRCNQIIYQHLQVIRSKSSNNKNEPT